MRGTAWQVMLRGVGLHQAVNITVPVEDVLDALRTGFAWAEGGIPFWPGWEQQAQGKPKGNQRQNELNEAGRKPNRQRACAGVVIGESKVVTEHWAGPTQEPARHQKLNAKAGGADM